MWSTFRALLPTAEGYWLIWVHSTAKAAHDGLTRQERRSRPGANTSYRKHSRTRHTITWDTAVGALAYEAVTDGYFPLDANDATLTDTEVSVAYRHQPNLERRHRLLRATQHADPVLLHDPAGIETLFCCQFSC